jgi:hypothetical protein
MAPSFSVGFIAQVPVMTLFKIDGFEAVWTPTLEHPVDKGLAEITTRF